MKKIIYTMVAIAASLSLHAQINGNEKQHDDSRQKLGIKFGHNWSYITGSKEGFKPGNKSGFMAGAFFAPTSRSGRGFRSEIVFSRQGYSFDDGGKNTEVLNNYVYLPQLATFNVGKFLQLQAGAQIGVLLNSKLSGTKDSSITGLMNRFDYGFAAGIELNPMKGLLIGGRYNLGLGKLYKRFETSATDPKPYPLPFDPEKTDFKNGMLQIFIGYKL